MRALPPGAVVAGYRIEAVLGRGGMGTVYRARHLKLERAVALKVIAAADGGDDAFRERFRREALAAATVEHPHVVPVFEADEYDDVLFLAMRLVAGPSLAELIRAEGRLEPGRAVRLVAQIASALDAAHACGVVHRDVKPANVLISGPPDAEHAYLTDFGIAKRADGEALTATGVAVGTLDYIAPEVLRGHRVDHRADVYSLGCLLFQALTGEVPFPRDSDAARVSAHLYRQAPNLSDRVAGVPAGLDAVVARALDKRPENRTQRAGEMGESALAAFESQGSRPVGRPASLPGEATPFVGRTDELRDIVVRLRRDDVRLLTLTGPGGIGKTRLALAATAEPRAFDGDVFFVDLTSVRSSESVLPAIAQALGVSESAERSLSDALVESLRHRSALLVLDNFEQVVDAAPDIARQLQGAPGLKVLATSRVPLRLAAEHQYAVPHMPLDDAVNLFAQRAAAARADFRLDDSNLPLVRALCTRLDRLPLGVTLAAARVRHLSLETMLDRLPHALDLLTGGDRDQPERQQTLRATLDWSYELLTGPEKELFGRLSIFAGGCTVESAEVVCGASLESVTSLLDSSLLSTDDANGPEPRLRMLETIREYAHERLEGDELTTTCMRHASHFLALAERAEPALWGGMEQSLWLQRLKAEHGNFRAALDWLITADAPEVHLRLIGALERFWHLLGHFAEASRQFDIALARAEEGHVLTGKVLWGAAMVANKKGDFDRARALSERQLEVCARLGDALGVARAHVVLGGVATAAGDLEAAESAYSRGLVLCRELRDDWGINLTISNLGDLALTSGDYEQAVTLANESVRLARERSDNQALVMGLGILAYAHLLSNDEDAAVPVLGELVSVSRDNELGEGLYVSLEGLACIAAAQDAGTAARLLGAADDLLKTLGGCMEPSDRVLRDRTVGMIEGRISGARLSEAWAQGRAKGAEVSIDEGLNVARSKLMRSETRDG